MAAKYIGVTYMTQQVGGDWLTSAFADTSASWGAATSAAFIGVVENASAIVGMYLRKMEYTVPATAVTNADLKSVTFAVVYEMLHARPENALALPEDWQFNPCKLLLEDLKAGEAHMSLSGSTEGPIGGVKFTDGDADTTTADGGRRGVFTRKNFSTI